MANGENPKRRKLGLILGVAVVAVVLLAAFSLRKSDIPIRAVSVSRGDITSVISTNGKIEPIDNFEAHAPAPTTVRKILVKAGDHVTAGQMLVQLDDSEARAQAAKAQAQLKSAEADLASVRSGGTREEVLTNQAQLEKARTERDAAKRNLDAVRSLQQRGAASAQEVQSAENKLKAAEEDLQLFSQKKANRYSSADISRAESQAAEARAALGAAQDLLQKSDIRAPKAGEVYSLPVRQGQYVNAGDLVVAVAKLSNVQVRAFVDEPDIGKLKKGQLVEVQWDAIPGETWKGTLDQLPTTVTARGSRNVGEFTCTIDNANRRLLPNTNVSVSVVTAKVENALSVPREAVRQDGNGRFVYQVVDGELRRANVDTAVSNLTRIQVTKGLSDQAVVALGTLSSVALRDGLQVRVVQQ